MFMVNYQQQFKATVLSLVTCHPPSTRPSEDFCLGVAKLSLKKWNDQHLKTPTSQGF
jgi:hypothetical protein